MRTGEAPVNDDIALIQSINELKKERNAIVLAHFYQALPIHEVADIVGDSLELSRQAAETDASVIVFAGVHFMAEMAKVLNQDRLVLLPSLQATCEMVDMVTVEDVRHLRAQHPGVPVVAYVNTSAAVKAESDICCTSRNAVDIVTSLDTDRVIFVPDQNMAQYVSSETGKLVEFPTGYCYVHKEMTMEVLRAKQKRYPHALVLAHPECEKAVLDVADVVASTGGMRSFAMTSEAKEFLVATEDGFVDALRRDFPEKRFYSTASVCRGMKAITLEKIKNSLEENVHPIDVDREIAKRAKVTIDRMLQIG